MTTQMSDAEMEKERRDFAEAEDERRWREEEERAERQEEIDDMLGKHLGRNVGLNADWSVGAWHLGPSAEPNRYDNDQYLLDTEDDHYAVVARVHNGGDDIISTLETFHVDDLEAWLERRAASEGEQHGQD